jgi:hypothetical protein
MSPLPLSPLLSSCLYAVYACTQLTVALGMCVCVCACVCVWVCLCELVGVGH